MFQHSPLSYTSQKGVDSGEEWGRESTRVQTWETQDRPVTESNPTEAGSS